MRSWSRKVRSPCCPVSTADAVIEQQGDLFAKLLLRSGVGNSDTGAALGEKKGAGHAGFAEADHQHALGVKVHRCFRQHKRKGLVLCRP